MKPANKTLLIQLTLFLTTIITTTLAGTEWIYGRSLLENKDNWLSVTKILDGLYFSVPFLAILTIHEFGHYFTARKNKVDVSLPYFIPFWIGMVMSIGTFGAFIRMRSKNLTNKQYFDIGIAGPLAGLVAAILVIWYGFTHLPPIEYIFGIHEEYAMYGKDFAKYVYNDTTGVLYFGDNLVFRFFESYVADPSLVPPKYEMMHYPYLFAGQLALFFTTLNLLPIGQLDGGHVLYGLVGHKWHTFFSKSIFIIYILLAGIGIMNPYMKFEYALLTFGAYSLFLHAMLKNTISLSVNRWMVVVIIASIQFLIVYVFPSVHGYPFALVFAFILGRFLGIEHPKAEEVKIGLGRKIIGWLTLVIFILCFTPQPFVSN